MMGQALPHEPSHLFSDVEICYDISNMFSFSISLPKQDTEKSSGQFLSLIVMSH
jgi:hypothetical protein